MATIAKAACSPNSCVSSISNCPIGCTVHPVRESVQRIMLATPGSEPIAEPEEVLLVDAVQHRDGRSLDNLVLERRHRQWALLAVRLRYIRPAGRLRPVRPSMDPCVQIGEVSIKVCGIGPPRQTVYARSGIALRWWKSAVNLSFFCCLAACRTRSSACDTRARSCARCVLCPSVFLLVPPLAPPAPRPRFWTPRRCSSASQLLRQGLTSHGRASSATAPASPMRTIRHP